MSTSQVLSSLSSARNAKIHTDQCLALAWFHHRRFESLTPPLGIRRYVMASKARKPLRELILTAKTIALLLKEKPRVVLVQNPSLACTLLVALLKPLFGYFIVVDAHGDAVIPYAHNWKLVRAVTFWLLRHTELTIVTNEGLAKRVKAHGGRPFVLCDNLPEVPVLKRAALGPGKHVVFISTYAPDEPHAQLFAAADRLRAEGITFHVTGKLRADRLAQLPMPPANVFLTGFLPEHEYWDLLGSCDAIVDLTTMPDCLVCGAYEAVALGRALVLTDNTPSRELFEGAAVYTQNTTDGIAAAVREALRDQSGLQIRSAAHAQAMRLKWNSTASKLSALISNRFRHT